MSSFGLMLLLKMSINSSVACLKFPREIQKPELNNTSMIKRLMVVRYSHSLLFLLLFNKLTKNL